MQRYGLDARNVVLFLLLIGLIIGRGLTLSHTMTLLERGALALKHSEGVLNETSELLSSVKDIETGQRGYLLTDNVTYLAPYQAAVASTDAHLRRLVELVSGDAPQQSLLDNISRDIQTMKAGAASSVQAMANSGADAARSLMLRARGTDAMDRIRRATADIQSRASRALETHDSEFSVTVANARTSIVLTTIAVLIIGCVSFVEVCRSSTVHESLVLKAETARAKEADTRAETERISRMKDEFLTTLSHELRNPLNAVLSWASLMRTQKMDQATLERGLETIERNARSQAKLIDDLLDMSRIVSGKMRLVVDELKLQPLVESAADVVGPAAAAKGITLRTDLDPQAGPISGDPERIRQILWNLLSNALKFTPKGGRIDVRLERINSHVSLSVTDTGQGIEPEFLPHVFERFRQADSSITRVQGGLGLGLGIAKHLVELQGGTIRVRSEGAGRGTAFIVNFPVRAVRAERGSAASITTATAGTPGRTQIAGLRILAIDDQPDTLDMLRTMLVRQGALVETAGSVDEGLSLFERWRPDVIVADIGMPGKDGYAFIESVRALPERQGGRTPAVALTAFARVDDRIRALRSGYQMHLAKPVEPDELIVVVASLAQRTAEPLATAAS
jgi:signal transduction histidine kinase/ActR/RegA family two-component response regulator